MIGLLAITLLAYSNSFQAGFTLDNKGLLRDPRLSQATAQNVGLIFHHTYWWPSGEAGLYRPLTSLSYLLNYAVFASQDQPAGYHWLNFLLHAANVVLVFLVLLRLTNLMWMSAAIAAVWAVHPVLTESVTNIVGRADLIATLATLSGFLMYLKISDTAGWRRAVWVVALMLVTTAGVFSKESAVCILGVIVLYEAVWWRERRNPKALLLGCVATLLPIAALLYQRSLVLAAALPAEFPFTDNPIVDAGFWTGRLTALKVIARYLWLIVWPARLSCDYSFSAIPLARGSFGDWASWIFVACVVVLIGFLHRINRTALFLALFAAVTFIPMSNLLFPIGTIMAERFLYLPSVGVLACLLMGGYALLQRGGVQRFAPLILCLIVTGLTLRTLARNSDWHDEFSIASASLQTSPNSFKLHRLLATLLFEGERTPENIERGMEEAERSVAILDALPDSRKAADAYCLEGGYYVLQAALLSGQPQDPNAPISRAAMSEYQKAVDILRRCAAIDQSVRAAYLQKFDLSRPRGNRTIIPASGDPQPYLMLSMTYLHLRDLANATEAASHALRLHPRNPAAYGQIANIFLLNNRQDDAAVALTEGLLLTSDPSLSQPLLKLYQSKQVANTCVLIDAPGGPTIDSRCEPFRQNICAVSSEVIKAHLQAGRADLAEQQRQSLIRNYGCSVASIDQLVQQQPERVSKGAFHERSRLDAAGRINRREPLVPYRSWIGADVIWRSASQSLAPGRLCHRDATCQFTT